MDVDDTPANLQLKLLDLSERPAHESRLPVRNKKSEFVSV